MGILTNMGPVNQRVYFLGYADFRTGLVTFLGQVLLQAAADTKSLKSHFSQGGGICGQKDTNGCFQTSVKITQALKRHPGLNNSEPHRTSQSFTALLTGALDRHRNPLVGE